MRSPQLFYQRVSFVVLPKTETIYKKKTNTQQQTEKKMASSLLKNPIKYTCRRLERELKPVPVPVSASASASASLRREEQTSAPMRHTQQKGSTVSSTKLGYGVAVGLVGTLGLGVAYSLIYGPNLSSTFLQSNIEHFPLKLESGKYLLNFTGENGLTKLTKQVYFNKRTAKKDVIKVILLEFNKTISNKYSKITGKRRRHLGISL